MGIKEQPFVRLADPKLGWCLGLKTASYKRWHLGPRRPGSETSLALWQRIALLTALVLGLSVTLGAAQALAISISGTVTDEVSGDPLEGISVQTQNDGGGYHGSAQIDAAVSKGCKCRESAT